MIDIKAFRAKYKITQAEICDIIKVKQPYLSAIEGGKRPLSKEKFEILYNHYGNKIIEFRIIEPFLPFGTGMAQAKDEGGGLKGIFGAISKNMPQATEWLERAESLSHENEELKAMVDSQQQTIQAHEATIEALKENIALLKESREQATGRVKAVVRSGEGEA